MFKKQKNKKRVMFILIILFFGLLLFLSNIFAYATAYFSWGYSGSEANAVIYSSNAYGNWGMMTSYTQLSSNNATNTSVYRIYVHDYTNNNPYYVYYPSGTYVNMWVNGTHVKQHRFNNDIRIYGTGYFQWFYVDVTLTNGVANEIKLQNTDGGGVQTRYFTPPASIYTITYDANGGTNAPPTQNFKFNSNEKISSQLPTRDGHTFKGWISDPNNKKFYPSDGIPYDWGSFTLRAEWEINVYSVTFKNWDGTILSTQDIEYGKDANPPNVPTRNGYTFKGWDGDYTNITSNRILTATFSINQYTVSFNTNGGSSIDNQIVNYGGKVTKPKNPIKEGLIFEDWYIDKTLKVKYDFNNTVSNNMVLYAKWIPYPQITTKYDRYYLVQEKFNIEDIKSKIKAVDEYNNDISSRIVLTGFENVEVGIVGDYVVSANVKTDLGYEANAMITIHISDDMPMQQIRPINQNALNTLSFNSKWWNNINILKTILEKDNVIDTITVKNE